MTKYRRQDSSLPAAGIPNAPTSPVPFPEAEAPLPPTRFKVRRPIYRGQSSSQAFTVDEEYKKYTLGNLSSSKTDILKFWEVRLVLLDGAMTHTLIGQQNRVSDIVCNRHGLSSDPGHISALRTRVLISKGDGHSKTKPYKPCAHGSSPVAEVYAQEEASRFHPRMGGTSGGHGEEAQTRSRPRYSLHGQFSGCDGRYFTRLVCLRWQWRLRCCGSVERGSN